MDSYVRPADVHAPKRHWALACVLFDGGPSGKNNPSPSSLAIGRWDNEPVLAMRWNGNDENPLGNPQSRGLPTWFVVPEQHWKQILETEHYSFSGDKTNFARDFLEFRKVYFLTRCPNPTCRDYQQLVLHEYRTTELRLTLEKLQADELKFYHIICDGVWKPNEQEKIELAAVLGAAEENRRLRSEVKVTAEVREDGLVNCSWSKRVDGRLFVHTQQPPLRRDQISSQLKAIGVGASDDQVAALQEQLFKSNRAELWIPQNTSKFFTVPGASIASP